MQAGSLQNDVWLAAFFARESLWTLEPRSQRGDTHARGDGPAQTAGLDARRRSPYRMTSRARLGIWLAALRRDRALDAARRDPLERRRRRRRATRRSAVLAGSCIARTARPRCAPRLGSAACVAVRANRASLHALAGARSRNLTGVSGWAACLSALVFLALPFGYATNVAQLATGASLRFATPAIAAGALLVLAHRRARAAFAQPRCSWPAPFTAPARARALLERRSDPARTRSSHCSRPAHRRVARKLRTPWPIAAGIVAAASRRASSPQATPWIFTPTHCKCAAAPRAYTRGWPATSRRRSAAGALRSVP